MGKLEGYAPDDPKEWGDDPPDFDAKYDEMKERCPKCGGTGYRRDWRGTRVQCEDCWSDNGPE